MHACVFANLRDDSSHAARHDLLRIRLPRVDHVVDFHATAKLRTLAARLGLRHPEHVSVRIVAKDFVVEVESELAQFPELISDVLARVGYGPI